MHFLTIIFLLVLATAVFYDLKYYAIPLFILLSVLIISIIRSVILIPVAEGLQYAGINMVGTLAILVISVFLLMIVRQKVINPVNSWLGSGDLLFLPVVCLSFSPVNFLVFFTGSIAVSLIVAKLFQRKNKAFPLAGSMGLLLMITLLSADVAGYDLYNDKILISLLT